MMDLFANKAGGELANSHYPGAMTSSQGVREVQCYPPVSQPLSRELTPLAQIAQHAERLFEELLSRDGEAPRWQPKSCVVMRSRPFFAWWSAPALPVKLTGHWPWLSH